jgi:hypothetical protein
LATHKLAVALHSGIYNFVRVHKKLGTTPAVASGVELEAWTLETVVDMAAQYRRRKEEAKFERAFAILKIGDSRETCPDWQFQSGTSRERSYSPMLPIGNSTAPENVTEF